MLDLSDALSCSCTITCRKQHVLSFFIWKIEWADLHQVVLLFLICMLYIMYTMNFIVLNNPLYAENRWSCILVMFSCQKSHVVNVAVFVFVIIQCLRLLVYHTVVIIIWKYEILVKLNSALGFTLSVMKLFIWQARVIETFSIHKLISDRMSRSLLIDKYGVFLP